MVITGDPVLGPVSGIHGAFMATGHAEWGILMGPSTGLFLSRLILALAADPEPENAPDPSIFAAFACDRLRHVEKGGGGAKSRGNAAPTPKKPVFRASEPMDVWDPSQDVDEEDGVGFLYSPSHDAAILSESGEDC